MHAGMSLFEFLTHWIFDINSLYFFCKKRRLFCQRPHHYGMAMHHFAYLKYAFRVQQ